MKKRLFGAVLAAVLVVSQAVTVFAAGSKTAGVSPVGDSAGYYEVTEGTAEAFSYLAGTADDVLDTITAINEGSAGLDSIADMNPGLRSALNGRRMVTEFFNLSAADGGVKTEDGKYIVTLEVTSITSSMTNIQILYYNTATGEWVVITPSDVDYANQTVTFVIDQLPAPICFIADDSESAADNSEGTSPQTGVTSGWTLWMGAAVILAGVSLTAYRRSKNK